MPTHYEVLGVPADADTETIRRAYLVVAKASHPDRRQSDDPDRRARAEDRIRAANSAWNVLRDPDRREAYDLSLPGPGATGAAAGPAAPGRRPSGIVGARPTPPSGVVVPAQHVSLWRYAADRGGAGRAPRHPRRERLRHRGRRHADRHRGQGPRAGGGGLRPRRRSSPTAGCRCLSPCGNRGAYTVTSITDTPRPCPPGSQPLPLSDQKTTLCLTIAS